MNDTPLDTMHPVPEAARRWGLKPLHRPAHDLREED